MDGNVYVRGPMDACVNWSIDKDVLNVYHHAHSFMFLVSVQNIIEIRFASYYKYAFSVVTLNMC